AEWWGKSLLVTFGLFSKVTRRKGGTNLSHHPITDIHASSANSLTHHQAHQARRLSMFNAQLKTRNA
ncbi:hypothetical protein, partial [Pseudomonas capeferrum]